VVITTINTHKEKIESVIQALETYELDKEAWELLMQTTDSE